MVTTPNRPPSCDKLECQCDMRTKLVGDGCAICNPELYADLCRDNDKPKLKECPACAGNNVEIPPGITWVFCHNSDCNLEGPINDPDGTKWNYIPRRLEVTELLRLVDASIIGTPTPAEGRLLQYADKLRREWKL